MKSSLRFTLLLGMGMAMTASSAMGAFTFNQGDLLLGFQATGGTGQFTNVFFNLGSGTYHRDNPGNLDIPAQGNNPFGTSGQTEIGNIGATLTLAFGAGWFDRSDVLFGIYGNLNSNPNTGIGSAGALNGDPSRTTYVSRDTATIGGSLAWAGLTSNSLGSAGTTFSGMEGMVSTLNNESNGAAILTQASNPTAWANGWSAGNPPAGAFNIFGGGIQQNFGEPDNVTYIDLQRILSTNTGANPAGTPGTGAIETTFAIGRNGSITAVPEPSSFAIAMVAGFSLLIRRRRTA
jgi:hypothetical protein